MAAASLSLSPTGIRPYGRIEIQRILHANLIRGLLISVVIHLAVVGGYYLVQSASADDDTSPIVRLRFIPYSELGPPPSLSVASLPPSVGVGSAAKPRVGVPVPVPDAEVSPERTIASQLDQSAVPTRDIGTGNGEVAGDPSEAVIPTDIDPDVNEFIAVEKYPQLVRRVSPVYPEMAIRAGMEGTVVVKILVGIDGKPRKAVVFSSTADIFNDAAIEASMQFLFTPAMMNNGPVKVWVAVPFRFRLKEVR